MFKRKKKPGADFFKDEAVERRVAEDDQPWFLDADDAPELDVEAGRSANMTPEDDARS